MTSTEVKHIARLAKLELRPKDIERFRNQLSSIINYIDELSEVDVKNIKPTSQTTDLTNVSRNDAADLKDSLTPDKALSGSDAVENNYFKIPRILEKEA